MKKFFLLPSLLCFVAFMAGSGCKKSSSSGTTTVTYQVSATNSSNIDISYTNVIGQKTQLSAQASWGIDVINPPRPFSASVQGASSSPFSSVQTTCTVTILVNGAVVKTATVSSNTVAVAEATYTLQ